MTEETRAMNKFETVISCYLDSHADSSDVTFLIDNKMLIHELKEVAEVTICDFQLSNSKKDRLVSIKEEFKETNLITICWRTSWSEVKQAWESNDAWQETSSWRKWDYRNLTVREYLNQEESYTISKI